MELSAVVRNSYRLLIFVVSAMGCVAKVEAYPTPVDFDGKLLRWNISAEDGPIYFRVKNTSADERKFYEDIVREAVDIWNDVSTTYFHMIPADDAGHPVEEHITVTYKTRIDGGDFSAGYTVFDKTSPQGPVHCEIVIADDANVSVESLKKTTLHELGHCIGLGHSLVPHSIMSYSLESNFFGLDVDDEAAVSRLYPADGSKPKAPLGCVAGRQTTAASQLIFVLLAAPLFFRRVLRLLGV